MYRYIDSRDFAAAYAVACLGVTDGDWRALGECPAASTSASTTTTTTSTSTSTSTFSWREPDRNKKALMAVFLRNIDGWRVAQPVRMVL